MTSTRLRSAVTALIPLVLVGGMAWLTVALSCDNHGPPGVSVDLSQKYYPADFAQSPQLDLAQSPFTVTGNGPSTYSPAATLTGFTCINDPSAGRYVKAALTDNFAASNPAHGANPLNLNIYTDGIQVIGTGMGVIYYATAAGSTFTTAGNSGTVPSTTLNGTSGAMGTLTVGGSWTCP